MPPLYLKQITPNCIMRSTHHRESPICPISIDVSGPYMQSLCTFIQSLQLLRISVTMLCHVCFDMLRRQDGRTWKGTYDLHFQHHSDKESLRQSAEEQYCGICQKLYDELKSKIIEAASQLGSASNQSAQLSIPSDRLPRGADVNDEVRYHGGSRSSSPGGPRFNVSAWLSVMDHPGEEDLYRLDFRLRDDRIRVRRTFILLKNNTTDPPYRTYHSDNTSSDEVRELVMSWIDRCSHNCSSICGNVDKRVPDWYPARLISLEELRKKDSIKDRIATIDVDTSNATVHLKETKNWFSGDGRPSKEGGYPSKNKRYVTLSHCWGQGVITDDQKLTSDTLPRMKRGIQLDSLPLTFRHAIIFAARLPDVGYIWIDSLCIKQGPDDIRDWLAQSAWMFRIYGETFLNISATHAEDSMGGLFQSRSPRLFLENEVVLNIEGLPGAHPPTSPSAGRKPPQDLKRCTILDASLWSERIGNAAVNRRAWVLQERLMSPRVLHFCKDQVAWECCGFDAAEGQPEGLPNFQLTSGEIIQESRLKGLNVGEDGKRLRSTRLQGVQEPEPHLQHEIHALELWRRIVEVYSKTAITKNNDKLIALSGIAKLMAEKIDEKIPAKYAAGLWYVQHLASKQLARKLLASQLLWQVEPVWREVDRKFENKSNTPEHYRAPSWSWAAVNANEGHGVTCADITSEDLYIEIETVSVIPQEDENIYGLVQEEGTYLELWGKLRKAVVYQHEKFRGRFAWRLLRRGSDVYKEEHTNVYLDCPADDSKNHMFTDYSKIDMLSEAHDDSDVYVIPAAKGPRVESEENKYLTCLMVQQDRNYGDQAVIKRIGITKLSPWADGKSLDAILETQANDVNMPHLEYNRETKMSKIRLI